MYIRNCVRICEVVKLEPPTTRGIECKKQGEPNRFSRAFARRTAFLQYAKHWVCPAKSVVLESWEKPFATIEQGDSQWLQSLMMSPLTG